MGIIVEKCSHCGANLEYDESARKAMEDAVFAAYDAKVADEAAKNTDTTAQA